jgi:O-antigen/teichoic acid export membrane protein
MERAQMPDSPGRTGVPTTEMNATTGPPCYRFLAKAADMGSQLATTVIAARYLGVAGYGQYALVVSLVMVLWPAVDMGLDHILLRDVGAGRRGVREAAGDVLAIRLFLLLASIPLLLVGTRLLNLAGEPLTSAWVFGVTVLGTRQVVQVLGRSLPLLRGRVGLEALLSLVFGAAKVGAVAFCADRDLGFLALFSAALVAEGLHAVGAVAVSARLAALPRFAWQPARWRATLRDGAPIGLSVFLVTSYFHVDSFVLKAYWPGQELGAFAAPYRLIGALTLLAVTVLWVFLPLLSRLASERQGAEMDAASRLIHLTVWAGALGTVVVTGVARPIIPAVYGESFRRGASLLSLQVLAPLLLLRPVGYVSDLVLVARRRQSLVCLGAGAGLAANLAGDLAFVPTLGAVGAAIGTLVGDVVYVAVTAILSSRVSGRALFRGTAAVPAAASVVGYALAAQGRPVLAVAGALFVCVCLLIMRKRLMADLRVAGFPIGQRS